MAERSVPAIAAPWTPPAGAAPGAPAKLQWGRFLPFAGPAVLFIIWNLVVRFGFIKAILLPSPSATVATLVAGLAGGPLLLDFGVTVLRTLEAFLLAAVAGVPLGVLLGSNEKA